MMESLATDLLDAVLDRSVIESKLEALSHATDAYGISVLPLVGRLSDRVLCTENLVEPLNTYFSEGWHERDFRAQAMAKYARTSVILEQQYASDDHFRNLEFYKSQSQYGLRWTAILPFSSSSEAAVFVLQRRIQDGPFSQREASALRGIQSKLMILASALSAQAKAHIVGVADGFDIGNLAAIFFDGSGRAVHVNQKAQSLLGRDLQLRSGRLSALNPADTKSLYQHLARTLSDGPSSHPNADDITLIRRFDRRPLIVRFTKLPPLLKSVFSYASVVATIIDLDLHIEVAPSSLVTTFRLTQREAQIAIHLARGMSLPQIADVLSISHETARTHLRSVFGKTDTRSQGELSAILRALRPP